MRAKFLFTLVFFCMAVFTYGQQYFNQYSLGGEPQTFKLNPSNTGVQFVNLPAINVTQLLMEDSINAHNKAGAFRFGFDHLVNYNLNNSGTWIQLESGDYVWTLGFRSTGALAMSASFSNIVLPQGCRLYVMNEDHSEYHGAFDENFASADTRMLGTEQLGGEGLVIELFVPQALRNSVSLTVYRVTHAYKDILEAARTFGASGTCMNNVRCPAYAGYDNQIRSVVCLVNGGEFCSGALINNTCNDGTPYILTANHCGTTPGAWTFRFNWESPNCTNPGSSPSSNSLTGGTFRAASSGSDFFLCEITAAGAEAALATYNVYYAGWDRTTNVPTNPYGIHHPSGDIKKISFTTGTATSTTINFNGNPTTAMWQTPTWTDGVTEPGSSGSPLFNSAGLIIGDLSGGPSDCSCEGNASCGYDYYGRFNVSWAGGGTNATRLSNWLDPSSCNTGATTLPGFDPNAVVYTFDAQVQSISTPSGTLCTGPVSPVITIRNLGTTTLTSMTINYQIDGGAPTAYAWTGSLATSASTVVTMPSITVAAGAHTYTATIVTGSLNGSNTDLNTGNNAQTSNYTGLSPTSYTLPFTYGFEPTAMPPTTPGAWSITNGLAGSQTWIRTTAAFSLGAASAKLNYWNDNTGLGTTDDLILPYLNLSTVTAPVNFTFDVAHRIYDNTAPQDSLLVEVSTNCGLTWTNLYRKGGAVLATVAGTQTGSEFVPTAAQWRNESISLGAYAGMNNVLVRFRGYSDYDQSIYLDNINITGTVPSPPTASFTTSGSTICAGQSVTFTSTSTGSPTSISWNFPGGSPTTSTTSPVTVTYNTAGTYTVTLTATNGAGANTTTQTVTVNALPTNTASNGGAYCVGANIQLNATAGATDYDWTGPGGYVQNNTQNPVRTSATLAMAGVYTVTVTNAAGCSNTATTTVVVNPLPTNTASNTGPFCVGSGIQLNATAGASDYDWTGPAAYVQNNTQNPLRAGATTAMAGVYTVTVTSAAGCSNTATTTVVVNSLPTATASNTGAYCAGTTIQLNASGSLADYDWTGPGGYTQNNTQNPTRPSSTTAMSGTYTVTYTDANGCSNTATTSVTVNPVPTANATNTGPYCVGANIQLNSVGGSATDDWSGPSYTANNTQNPVITSATTGMTGIYTVTVTNGLGCTATSTTSVVVNPLPTNTASNTGAYCAGATIQLNATSGAADYDWTGPGAYVQNNTQNPTRTGATLAMAGVYTVTVTSAAGCINTATTTVVVNTNPSAPVITPSGATTFCAGGNVNLSSSYASGNIWSTSASTQSINVTSGGIYTVTYTDLNGCTSSASQTVTVNALPSSPVITPSGPTDFCTGGNVNLTSSYGSGNVWSTSATTASINVTSAGTYTVVYTDGNGCTSSASQTVSVYSSPPAPVVSSSSGAFAYCTGGSVDLSSSYSSGNLWSTSATSQTVSISTSGTYTVTYTDPAGCSSSASVTVAENPLPSAPVITSSTGSLALCAGSSINLSSSYASGNLWSTSATTQTITVTTAGTYNVTYTDANGCTSTSSATTTVNPLPAVSLGTFSTMCDNDGALVLSGGSPAGGTYSGPGVSGGQFNPATAGIGSHTITYSYTDVNGCSNSANQTLSVISCLSVQNDGWELVNIYPNPVSEIITLSGLPETGVKFEILNTLGQIIQTGVLNNNTIDVSTLRMGTYYLRINQHTWKMIKA